MSFASLKKASSKGDTFAKLSREIEKLNQLLLVLLLMSVSGNLNLISLVTVTQLYDSFLLLMEKICLGQRFGVMLLKVPSGQWYIENSLTTLGKDDPVGELNRELWNSGRDSDKEIARAQKRKLSYYSNIYVVQDPAHPENEGRVFLYKFGKKIFDKLVEAMQPAFADETPIDPFNFWKGADFKLKIRKVDGYWNYDKSEFAAPKTLGNFDDDKLESIWKEGYSLAEFEAEKNFKSYEDLQKRLNLVLGKGAAPVRPNLGVDSEEYEPQSSGGFNDSDLAGLKNAVASSPVEDSEDTLSYFAKLAGED